MFTGGLSGVAFGEEVALVSRVTQGCQPVGKAREITAGDVNVLTQLDGEPALDVLLADLNVTLDEPQPAIEAVRATLVGLSAAGSDAVMRTGEFGSRRAGAPHHRTRSRRRRGVAVADRIEPGMRLAFCRRDMAAARTDLMRICAEIREELEPEELTLETATALAASEAERGAASGAAHCRRHLRELRGPRRPALRGAERGTADRAPRAGRRATGGILRRRRDRAPTPIWLHGRVDGVYHRALNWRGPVLCNGG